MVPALWCLFGCGLILAGIGLPLMQRRVGPNPLYGVRIRATLEDPYVWYETNAKAGRDLLGLGLLVSLASGLSLLWNSSSPLRVLLPLGTLAFGTLVLLVRSLSFARRLAKTHLRRR